MPRFAANISLMYTEWPFVDRFAAAADDGFEAVECQFPYEVPAETLARRREAAGVELVLLNAPPARRAHAASRPCRGRKPPSVPACWSRPCRMRKPWAARGCT